VLAKLYGVGVGPGKTEFLTLKAVKTLQQVDYILTPTAGENKNSTALLVVKEIITEQQQIKLLNFKMSKSVHIQQQVRKKAAAEIYHLLSQGKSCAFITIGDPLFYSTFNYLVELIKSRDPELLVETIPGITAISACTAANNLPLAAGKENTAILSKVKNKKQLSAVFKLFETVVILKLSQNFKQTYQFLSQAEFNYQLLLGSRVGLAEEFFSQNLSEIAAGEIQYLSLLIIKKIS
jgi:precorrin-2/cobalt-factor-2 C20-methyltransferase